MKESRTFQIREAAVMTEFRVNRGKFERRMVFPDQSEMEGQLSEWRQVSEHYLQTMENLYPHFADWLKTRKADISV
jgi:hypothetical protein